jgi:hypothetical protein
LLYAALLRCFPFFTPFQFFENGMNHIFAAMARWGCLNGYAENKTGGDRTRSRRHWQTHIKAQEKSG